MANTVLTVEGVSDHACLSALDRRIGVLAATRHVYTGLHEVAHVVVTHGAIGTDSLTALNFGGPVILLWDPDQVAPANWSRVFPTSAVQPDPALLSLFAEAPSRRGLPVWNTRAFAGLTTETWFSSGSGLQATDQELFTRSLEPPRPAPSRVTFHVPVGTGALLVDGWAAMIRVIDSVLTALLLMRLLVRAGLRRRIGAISFVLGIVAVCRRYGRRSEPDDHASLLIRRHLVSMGSCLLV